MNSDSASVPESKTQPVPFPEAPWDEKRLKIALPMNIHIHAHARFWDCYFSFSNTGSYFQEGKADIEAGEIQNENQAIHVPELGAVRCEGRDGLSENIRIPIVQSNSLWTKHNYILYRFQD